LNGELSEYFEPLERVKLLELWNNFKESACPAAKPSPHLNV
jgi:hypothetical protein